MLIRKRLKTTLKTVFFILKLIGVFSTGGVQMPVGLLLPGHYAGDRIFRHQPHMTYDGSPYGLQW